MTLKKIIAISAEVEALSNNQIFDYSIAKYFPGALWPYYFKTYIGEQYQVVTADVALRLVRKNKSIANDILIIQHVHDPIATSLIDLGCFPFLIVCFESPLYVGKFYDQVEKIVCKFKYQYLPNGLMKRNKKIKVLSPQMCFPSYENIKTFSEIKNWHDRNFMVLVASNKYTLPKWPREFFSLQYLFWWAKFRLIELIYGKRCDSNRFRSVDIELQTYRLQIVNFFLHKDMLDIYGKGWDSLKNLPPYWQKKLHDLTKLRSVTRCKNKISQIQAYKFCLCIENASFPGYVTEKIIECFVAGVVPLYIGAPDIEDILPKDSFINLRNFKNFYELNLYLNQLTSKDAERIIDHGRNFLMRSDTQLYSYQGFAESIIELLNGN